VEPGVVHSSGSTVAEDGFLCVWDARGDLLIGGEDCAKAGSRFPIRHDTPAEWTCIYQFDFGK
jgi:hypothetical protein